MSNERCDISCGGERVHRMKLQPAPFEMIKGGLKTVELRLLDEKRRRLKAGDVIIFESTATGDVLTAFVKALHQFDSFEELYRTMPLTSCGYTSENVHRAQPEDMEKYYSAEEIRKYGVVGIEIGLFCDKDNER